MMKIELTGKQSLVTGSTAGIGLAIAQGLAEAGASVTIVGRDQAKVDKALAEIANASGRDDAKGIIADPGTAEGCRTIIEQLPEVDVLVNNLGIYGGVPFFLIFSGRAFLCFRFLFESLTIFLSSLFITCAMLFACSPKLLLILINASSILLRRSIVVFKEEAFSVTASSSLKF